MVIKHNYVKTVLYYLYQKFISHPIISLARDFIDCVNFPFNFTYPSIDFLSIVYFNVILIDNLHVTGLAIDFLQRLLINF